MPLERCAFVRFSSEIERSEEEQSAAVLRKDGGPSSANDAHLPAQDKEAIGGGIETGNNGTDFEAGPSVLLAHARAVTCGDDEDSRGGGGTDGEVAGGGNEKGALGSKKKEEAGAGKHEEEPKGDADGNCESKGVGENFGTLVEAGAALFWRKARSVDGAACDKGCCASG